MSFTSAVVAQSHYEGKIHAKRLKLLLGETTNTNTGKYYTPIHTTPHDTLILHITPHYTLIPHITPHYTLILHTT